MKTNTSLMLGVMTATAIAAITVNAQERINSIGSTNQMPTASTSQASFESAILIQQETIKQLLERLRYLQQQLKAVQAERPREPERDAFSNEETYAAAVAAYEAHLAQWQAMMANIMEDIERVFDMLQREQAILAAMLNEQSRQIQQIRRTEELQRAATDGFRRTDSLSYRGTEQADQIRHELVEFDQTVDEELADFVLEQEAELSGVQTRGTVATGARARILAPADGTSRTSISGFRKQTKAVGIDDAIDHVEAVRLGARPNPTLVATAIVASLESHPHQDPMRAAFMVFRASIQQANSDKAYHLARLQRYNQIGNALSEYMKQLNDAMGSGSGCSEEESGSQNIDTSILDPDLRTLAERMLVERAWVEGDDGIARTIRQLQQMEGQVRNRRQNASSAFSNFDQKTNQLYNLLSSVMKAMNEMNMGTVRNML